MISTIIPPHNYELVRDRIGTILANEALYQAALMNTAIPNSGNYLLATEVRVERTNPIDKIDIPVINVSLINGDYSNKHQGNVLGGYNYAIDCYTNAKTTALNEGDQLAAFRLQKLMGFCRYVLEDPIYKTLNFPMGFIAGSLVTSFQIQNIGKEDAVNSAMARLIFNVKMAESNSLIVAPQIAGWQNTVLIDNTTSGYFYEGQ